MIKLFLDIETCPSQNPQVRTDIETSISPPGNISKQETIDRWNLESKPAAVEEAWLKTSFDGAHGHICVIGCAIDDEKAFSITCDNWPQDEGLILCQFYDFIDEACKKRPNERVMVIGHNVIEFDLKFIFQRSVALNVQPSSHIPFNAKPWDDNVYDTMVRWGARTGGSLDKICKAIGIGGKGDINGSMVWPLVKAGRIADVAQYCIEDVEMTRKLFHRMIFSQ